MWNRAKHFLPQTNNYLPWSCFLMKKRSIIPKMTFRLVFQYLDPFNLTTLSLIKLSLKEILTSPWRKLPNLNKKRYARLCVRCGVKRNRPIPFQKVYPLSDYRGRQIIYVDKIWKSLMPYHILAYYLIILQNGSLKLCQKTSCKCLYDRSRVILQLKLSLFKK